MSITFNGSLSISGSAIIPNIIPSNLVLHLDASDTGNTITTGSLVDVWQDKSGSGHDFTSTDDNRPEEVSSVQNGLTAIQFTDTAAPETVDKFLASSAVITIGTVFVVAKYSFTTFQDLAGLFNGDDAGDDNLFFTGSTSAPSDRFITDHFFVDIGPTEIGRFYVDSQDLTFEGGTGVQRTESIPNLDQWHIYVGVRTSGPITLTGYSIGIDRNFGDRGWDGFIGEIRAYNNAMDDTTRQTIENELSTKWNIPLV